MNEIDRQIAYIEGEYAKGRRGEKHLAERLTQLRKEKGDGRRGFVARVADAMPRRKAERAYPPPLDDTPPAPASVPSIDPKAIAERMAREALDTARTDPAA